MRTGLYPWLRDARTEAQKKSGSSGEITLFKGEIRRIPAVRRGVVITCREGCVWVTQTGDPRDIILQRGQCAQTAKHGLVLIESIEPAVLWIF